MPRILKTPLAKEDLKAIGRYIRRETSSRERAAAVLHAIDEKARLYARSPEIGELRVDLGDNVRMFVAANYVCLYQPLPDGIELLRVVHATRDLPEVWRRQTPNDPRE